MTVRADRIRSLDQIRRYLQATETSVQPTNGRDSAYAFVRKTLVRFKYYDLRKPDKGLVKAFLGEVTGLSRAQLTRLIAQHRATGDIRDRRCRLTPGARTAAADLPHNTRVSRTRRRRRGR